MAESGGGGDGKKGYTDAQRRGSLYTRRQNAATRAGGKGGDVGRSLNDIASSTRQSNRLFGRSTPAPF